MSRAGGRIVITGGGGLIGRHLVRAPFTRGGEVPVLSRTPAEGTGLSPNVKVARYTPTEEGPWFDELRGASGCVSLAGEPLVGVRWSDAKKKEFESSRIRGNEMLLLALERAPASERPRVLIGASGVGYYGPHPADEELDETSPAGRDYVALLAARWERAIARAGDLGVRVVHTRFGIALGKGGGALERMALPFRMHVGGPLGSGKQIFPWVHIDDVIGILLLALDREDATGAINVTSPHPVSMEEFAEGLANVLHRRSYMRVPEAAVRALFGEGAERMLKGKKVLPRVAQRLGYQFRYPELAPALASALGLS